MGQEASVVDANQDREDYNVNKNKTREGREPTHESLNDDGTARDRTNPLSDFVDFAIQEVVGAIEVLVTEHALPYEPVWYLAFQVHHQL